MASETMLNVCFTIKERHNETIKRLATEARMNNSECLRFIVESISDTHVAWIGDRPILERPKFRWDDPSYGRYI
jgi:hypothetical protein